MILKAVLYALVFVVVVVVAATVFSYIYASLDTSLNALGEAIPVDTRYRDTTFSYLRSVAWLVTLSAIAVFIVYAVHTRRR